MSTKIPTQHKRWIEWLGPAEKHSRDSMTFYRNILRTGKVKGSLITDSEAASLNRGCFKGDSPHYAVWMPDTPENRQYGPVTLNPNDYE